MRDLFDWAEERASTVVIQAERLFNRRREAALTRLIFGPPLPRLDGVVLPYRSRSQTAANTGSLAADKSRATQ